MSIPVVPPPEAGACRPCRPPADRLQWNRSGRFSRSRRRRMTNPMSTTTRLTSEDEIDYPESDGEPMAENTVQYDWITTIKGGLDVVFRHAPDVFVAGDLFWYPVRV